VLQYTGPVGIGDALSPPAHRKSRHRLDFVARASWDSPRVISNASLSNWVASPPTLCSPTPTGNAPRRPADERVANTGQDCCARSRQFIERSISTAVERFIATTRKLIVDDPAKAETSSVPWFRRATSDGGDYLADARKTGREIAFGGGRRCPKATIRAHRAGRRGALRSLLGEEIFGPVSAPSLRQRGSDDREVNACRRPERIALDQRFAPRAPCRPPGGERRVSVNSHSSVHVERFRRVQAEWSRARLGHGAMEGYTELKNVYVGIVLSNAAQKPPPTHTRLENRHDRHDRAAEPIARADSRTA